MIIYTIGYSGFKTDKFIEALKNYGITFLIDVRSLPFSRFFPDFNEKKLSMTLSENGIKYKNLKTEFGARQDDTDFYTNGYLNFEKFAASAQFKDGIKQIFDLLKTGETICLMCAEKDPLNCHRAILCGKELLNAGIEILHIIPNKKAESHTELEKRLVNLCFKNPQTNMFDSDKLQESYRLHNKKIGYKK